jgi:hypothetical protein
MDYRSLFADVRSRPGMFGLDGSFHDFTVFLRGCEAGNDWQLLAGFRESLVARCGRGNNRLLDEFLQRRGRHGGLAEIFEEYLTWLNDQDWHRPRGSGPPSMRTSPQSCEGM